jgi:hypothetical protein
LVNRIKEKIRLAKAIVTDGSSVKADGWLTAVAVSLAIAAGEGLWKHVRHDYIFSPQDAFVAILKANFKWPGGEKHSPDKTAMFLAHNGKYSKNMIGW